MIEKGAPLYAKNKNKEIPLITALRSSYSGSMMVAKAMKRVFDFDIQELDRKRIWRNIFFYDMLLNEIKAFTMKNTENILKFAVKC